MSIEANKAVVRRTFEEVWNQGNADAVPALYAPDVVWHAPHAAEGHGPAFMQRLVARVRAAFADFQLTCEELIAEGDQVVSRYTITGTHRGTWEGIAPTGKEVALKGVSIARLRDGKCVEVWNMPDALGLLQQLGVIPASGQQALA